MFACFYVPDFPVQAVLLAEAPERREEIRHVPLAVLDGPANLPRVFATNLAARRAGMRNGMTKLQVETYGGVLLRKRLLAGEEAAQSALMDFAGTFSPRVESTQPGAVILDFAGTQKLLGSPEAAAGAMSKKAIAIGFELRVAVAANPDTAFLAGRGFPANTVIPAGEEARRLGSLPVNLLPASAEMLGILEGWGIRSFQALAALPSVAIVERLGQEGLYLQKLARGQVVRPLLTVEAESEFAASFEFEDPVETLESMFFILNRLLQQLCSNLMFVALATNELRLTVGLEVRDVQGKRKAEQYQHDWKLPVPTQDKNLLFGLVRLQLERTTFSTPIQKLTVEVIPVKPRVAQGNLFATHAPETEKLEMTLERIRGVVGSTDGEGAACVGSAQLVDTHRPGSFFVQHFSTVLESADLPPANAPVVALRVFRPALATSVELDGVKPHFVWLGQKQRRVLAASGPWSSSGNWWNALAWRREEWDVALKTPAGVGFYRIFRDRLRRRWFVEGVFD